jgi:hypothetical protein
MLIFGTDLNEVEKTKSFLSKSFDMKDLGEADVILGIKIIRDGENAGLSQSHYKYTWANSMFIPFASNIH